MTLDDSSLPLAQDNFFFFLKKDKTSPKHPAFFNKQLYIVTYYNLKLVISVS